MNVNTWSISLSHNVLILISAHGFQILIFKNIHEFTKNIKQKSITYFFDIYAHVIYLSVSYKTRAYFWKHIYIYWKNGRKKAREKNSVQLSVFRMLDIFFVAQQRSR